MPPARPPQTRTRGCSPARPSSCSTHIPRLALAAWNGSSGPKRPFLETHRFSGQDKPGPRFLLKAPSPHRTPQVPVSLLLSSLGWRGDELRGSGSGRRLPAASRTSSPSPRAADRARPAHWDGPAQAAGTRGLFWVGRQVPPLPWPVPPPSRPCWAWAPLACGSSGPRPRPRHTRGPCGASPGSPRAQARGVLRLGLASDRRTEAALRAERATNPKAQLEASPALAPCRPERPRTLTYVGELALRTQGHAECGGRRRLGRVVARGRPARGVGVSPLLGVLLALELVPVGGGGWSGWAAARGVGAGLAGAGL